MNWKLMELEVALIAAIVLIACYCRWDEPSYIIYIFMAMMVIAPIFCWGYCERMMHLSRKGDVEERIRLNADKKQTKEVSILLKKIDELNMKIDDLSKKYQKLQKDIETMKTQY